MGGCRCDLMNHSGIFLIGINRVASIEWRLIDLHIILLLKEKAVDLTFLHYIKTEIKLIN